MNQNNHSRSDWYAPPPPRQAQAPYAPQQPRRAQASYTPQPPRAAAPKNHTGARIAGIVVCVLLVLVASVYLFSDSFGVSRFSWWDGDKSGERTFTIDIPGSGNDDSDDGSGAIPDDYAKDYRDFFSRGFADYKDENVPSRVQRAESGAAFRVTLESAAGRQEENLQALYPECLQSVVGIRTLISGRPGYYMGTGIVMSEDGYILTNQHLLSGTDKAYVTLPDGEERPALLVGEDAGTDLAVLKIEAEGLHPAVFGDSADLTVGDSVFAIGNPMLPSLKGTLTSGIVSGLSRSVSSGNHPMTLIQHTAPINEGNSGGPLFNMYGQVVGVTNMKLVNPYSDVQVEGLCFAVPSATVKTVTDHLLSSGSYVRPGIGITVGAITAEDAEHYGLPGGLYISAVSAGSDAQAKGVKAGDILTHVNGQPVRETDDVLAIRDTLQVGDRITLTVFRDGETRDYEIELYDLSQLY